MHSQGEEIGVWTPKRVKAATERLTTETAHGLNVHFNVSFTAHTSKLIIYT